MTEFKNMRNEACLSRMGVVTPDCSGGGNPTWLVSICPAFSGGFLYKTVKKTFKSLRMSTGSYIWPLFEMTHLPDPAYALTGSSYNRVVSGRKNYVNILIVQ